MVNKTKSKQKNMKFKTKKNKIQRGGRTLLDNFSRLGSVGLQLVNKAGDIVVNKIGTITGTDANIPLTQTIDEIKDEVGKIASVIKSPAGQELLEEAKDIATETITDVINPAIKEGTENLLENSGEIIQQGESAVMNAIKEIPGPGTALAAAAAIQNVVGAVESATDIGKSLLGQTENIIKGVQEKKSKYEQLKDKFTHLMDAAVDGTTGGIQKLAGIAEDNIPDTSSTLSNVNLENPLPEKYDTSQPTEMNQTGGFKRFKRLMKTQRAGGIKLINRINKSKMEFLRSTRKRK